MRNHGLVVPALLFTLAFSGRSTASEENAAAIARTMLGLAAAPEEPCRGMPEGAGPGTAFVCARASSDFETFRESWDQSATRADKLPTLPKPKTDWLTQAGGRMRWYAVDEKWLVVTYDSSSHRVVISYPRDKEGVIALTKGITPPKRFPTDYNVGENRRQARLGLKADTQGVVVLSGVIRKNGSIDGVEVLGCLPRNRGLEAAAINALKQWKCEPAMKDGVPVDVYMVASFTYGPGGSFRESGSSVPETGIQGHSGNMQPTGSNPP